ncbi:MAG: hypothetical protein WKF77_16925 [Planctomycetaceae bacterium]
MRAMNSFVALVAVLWTVAAYADIDNATVEAGRAVFKGKIDPSHDLVVRIDRGDEPIEWRSSRTGGGEFEVVVEASDKIRLEGGKTGHGFVVASKILTSSDIKYVHCAGDLAGTFAIRREVDFMTRDGVLTFADITLKDGKKLPVSLRLAVTRTVAPARAEDADDKVPPAVGDAKAGRDVFRFETFGNEGFWTDAMRLPQGMKKEKVTPLQLLETGFHIDADALDADLRKTLADEFKTDRSAAQAPSLNDPAMTMKIVEANALIGVVPKAGRVGIACAICHTITDASVAELPGKGSIGKRLDGRATHSLDMGKALAIAENSRAAYPNLQLELGGKTIGRAPKGLRKDSTEEEVDAFLKNPKFYPRGTFDETQDGIGNPVQNTPLFRQDLAGPYGSAGEFAILDHIGNASFTTNLDPTTLVTPEGREFLKAKAGELGEELADNYDAILKETGVKDYPFVTASTGHKVGDLASPVGRKVDMKKVRDMSAYIKALPAPPGLKDDAETIARGKNLFRASCTKCHNEIKARRCRPTSSS